jgi:TRAP-type transport system periplasmic protein
MNSPSIRWVLVLLLGSLLHPCRPAAEELVLGHFMGTNHPMHRDVFLPLADNLVRLSGGELTLRIVPDLTNSAAQYARAVSGELDLAFGLPGYTKDRFPRTQLIELPNIVEGAQEATRVLGRSFDLVLKTEYPDVVVLSLWVNEAAVLLCRDRAVRSLEDFSGLRVRAADAQSARILTLMGAIPVVIPADGILSAFQAREIDAALIGASGVLPFRLQTVSKSCTVGFPSLFTGFFLVMNRQRWSSLSQASRGWLMESTGPGLGAVATAAYERSAQKGLEALAAAGVSVMELPVSEAARLKNLTGVVHEDVLGSLAAKGIDGRSVLDCYRPRVEPGVVGTTVEVRIFGAPGVRYRLENSSDLIRWQMAADVVIDPVSIPIRFWDLDSGIRSFFRSTEVLPGTTGRTRFPDHF